VLAVSIVFLHGWRMVGSISGPISPLERVQSHEKGKFTETVDAPGSVQFSLRVFQVPLGQVHIPLRGVEVRMSISFATLNTSIPASMARVP